jgi:predicted nucleotidyltransferase
LFFYNNHYMHRIISGNLDNIVKICEKYKVSRLYAFGSVISEKFSEETSDLDLQVELEPMSVIDRGEKLIQFWDELENLFQRKVDLLTDQPIRNPFFKEKVEKTKQLIYDGTKQKVSV